MMVEEMLHDVINDSGRLSKPGSSAMRRARILESFMDASHAPIRLAALMVCCNRTTFYHDSRAEP
jgi:hypothetical protein